MRIGRVGWSSLQSVVNQRNRYRYMSCPRGVWSCGMYMEVAKILDSVFFCRRATAM